ncbi:uncharacterized protein LOC129719704 [Wyeomyia smithii]|uniref:uncharacterized protein LOC129719704 n=1 Tax=Wyeomyia smithii TaxID=174621 RepID=UPI0024681FA9|nr:uncharacterized protein LOC129719704 [Wyeomyia smithii]
MENKKYTREEFLDLANERLLQNLSEYNREYKANARNFAGQNLLNGVGGSELISKSVEMDSNSSRELVRYHSVVELDEIDDEFDSCKGSTENVAQRPKIGWMLTQPPEKPTAPALPGPIPIVNSPNRQDVQNTELSNFVQKKSIAQGMMDLALVSANTNQLRYVIDIGQRHPYFYTSIALIITSLVMQLIVGLALIYNSRFNIRKKREMQSADRINDLSVIGVFLITLVNVFISTFNGSNSGPYSADLTSGNATIHIPDIDTHGTISDNFTSGGDGI